MSESRSDQGHPLFYEWLERLGPRFEKVLAQMADLHARKNRNYAGDGNPLSNLQRCERIGVPSLAGVVTRLQDKWSRIETLMNGIPDLVGESLADTLLDNAVYSLLALVIMQEAQATEGAQVWRRPLRAW